MALTIETLVLGGKPKDAILVEAGSHLPLESITDFDVKWLEAIDAATIDGAATFVLKLKASKLPNGRNAYDFYEALLINEDDYNARLLRNRFEHNASAVFADHEDRISDLEDAAEEVPQG